MVPYEVAHVVLHDNINMKKLPVLVTGQALLRDTVKVEKVVVTNAECRSGRRVLDVYLDKIDLARWTCDGVALVNDVARQEERKIPLSVFSKNALGGGVSWPQMRGLVEVTLRLNENFCRTSSESCAFAVLLELTYRRLE